MRKKSKRIAMLITLIFMTSFLLVVSTYAWFIGMKTVNVSNFDVEIAATEGLYLSMDGQNWTYNLDAKGTDISSTYANNTNTWATDGLSPVSTVGDMDENVSRLILYEKGSLTVTPGGYRLLASRVHNYDPIVGESGVYSQGKGYVAFDLFVKNLSGAEYYTENNIKNEEAIYLTVNSAVKSATVGGVAGTGIENSVRVAITQIGRVEATDGVASVENIQAIQCKDVAKGANQAQVTKICRGNAIWEPNDKKHVGNAINWYNTSCLPRTGADKANVNVTTAYGTGACGTVTNGTSYPTYVIANTIKIANNVNVYDGAAYNGYSDNIVSYDTYSTAEASTKETYSLVDYPFFTDTDKLTTGKDRKEFMSLAPNSITKLRVYIYIEGQDIDNYDFAQLGKKISINFGFTKERYTQNDFDYDGPETNTYVTPAE